MILQNETIAGGRLTTSGTGVIDVTGGTTLLDGSVSAVTLAGDVFVANNVYLIVQELLDRHRLDRAGRRRQHHRTSDRRRQRHLERRRPGDPLRQRGKLPVGRRGRRDPDLDQWSTTPSPGLATPATNS